MTRSYRGGANTPLLELDLLLPELDELVTAQGELLLELEGAGPLLHGIAGQGGHGWHDGGAG
jgi:hypothetical protein